MLTFNVYKKRDTAVCDIEWSDYVHPRLPSTVADIVSHSIRAIYLIDH